MKIIIDNSNLYAGGGIQVTTSFINDLNNLDLDHEFHVIQSPNSAKAINATLFKKNITFHNLTDATSRSIIQRIKQVKNIENTINPDIIFTVFGPSYHKSKFPKLVGFAIPFMIYPNSPFFDKISLWEKLKYKFVAIVKKRAFLLNSNALVFETDNAKEIFSKFSKKQMMLYTASNTLNEIFSNDKLWEPLHIKSKSNLNIVYLTSNYPHKNISIIPEIIEVLINKYKLSDFKFLISVTKDEMKFDKKYDTHIEYLGKISLNKIPDLYKQSHIALIPTLLEVFSATYLEAMHMRLPIVASDMPFSRDICADAALYSNPVDAQDYAKNIFKLANDTLICDKLIAAGTENVKRFGNSMDRTSRYLNMIEETANLKN